MSDMHEVGWDDTSVATQPASQASRKVERFTAKQGQTHRVTVLTEKPIRTYTHYKRGYGYFSCLKAEGLECVACAANDRVSEKFASNLLVYPAGTKPGSAWSPDQLKVMLWQPGPKVFGDLRQIVSNWGPLQNYDLEIHCSNEQYQHLNITNTPKLLWKEHPQAQQIASMIESSLYDLKKLVGGRKETVEEVRQIWTSNITRDALRASRDNAGKGSTMTPYANPGQTEMSPAAPAQLPNFADLLRTR
jgi:hypothetical protein